MMHETKSKMSSAGTCKKNRSWNYTCIYKIQ